ncbi:L-lactate dehydrogenase [Aquisphaera insulae]|uniref:L-lactate dehydrogenase n=1 Tax=Aquisphaera insulae TaxID=2712864 RepID=UPI0013EC7103|nr:L-lactate dehydrogenase [Aquisphaera insulae]
MTGLPPRNKVGLVGTGMVGASFAYALMQSGVANELILIDADEARAEGEAMDLNHGMPFVSPMRIRAGGYDLLAGCDLTVITAGANQRPGQTRLELIQKNAGVIRDIVPKVVAANPRGTILVATNPVDVLTEIAAEVAGLPPGHVFGSGTTLDTARFRFLIGDYFDINPQSVHAYILGEHGDSAVPAWSMAKIAGIPIADFLGRDGRRADATVMQRIYEQTRDAAYEIIQRKKSTYYAIGLALRTVVEAVLRNEQTVLTVCSPIRGLFGIDGISLSLPTIVGHGGAETVLQSPISPAEIELLRKSASILREMYESVRA